MSDQYEQIDHPSHYQIAPCVEAIDLCEALGFNPGNAVKYLCRAGKKPGVDALTDLKKSLWYVQREIERLERES
jgi:hypothetical protein